MSHVKFDRVEGERPVSVVTEIDRAEPFHPHDEGCNCYPHVSQRAAIEAAIQAATAEYRTNRKTAELFAFEVPTSWGRFRIVGPNSLPADEARRVGAQIARLLPLLLLEQESLPCIYRPPFGLMCGKPEADLIHAKDHERMGGGRHVYRSRKW